MRVDKVGSGTTQSEAIGDRFHRANCGFATVRAALTSFCRC